MATGTANRLSRASPRLTRPGEPIDDKAPGHGRTANMTGFSCSIDELTAKVAASLDIDPARGTYRGRRDAFTDPDIFELEMRYIFEGNWIYLAHESQLPNNGD
jgi:hypothetical protein